VVIIVADGRKKINPRVLHVLNVMGLYNENLVRNLVDNKPVKAHLFEYTTQIGVDRKMNVVHRTSIPPTQVVFILKENNAKKINSHKWFFEAVCESLDPEVCMLLDVGTKPEKTSLWHLWRSFERNPMIGGSCGEIVAEIGRFGSKLINPLVASQNL
jgi:chitin synthase